MLRTILMAALLAGGGFTMSRFIVTAAFHDPLLADTAKLAVLVGSALSAGIALIALMLLPKLQHLPLRLRLASRKHL